MKKFLSWVGTILLIVLLVGGVIFFGMVPKIVGSRMNAVINPPPYEASEAARALHETLFIADLHADSLLWDRDLLRRSSWGHVDVPRLLEANMALQAFTVVTKTPRGQNIEANSGDAFDNITLLSFGQLQPIETWGSLRARALNQARIFKDTVERSEGKLVFIRSAKDLADFEAGRAENPDRVAGFLGIEGAHCLEGEIENVDVLFDAGFRMMGPTHFFDNELGGSAHGESKAGLTDFGKEVIRRMEELEMIVDLAHSSPALIDDVLAMATRPVLVSHTGVRGTCDNQRNLSDAHIKGIAKTGGVIGIGFWETATCGEDAAAIAGAMRYTADLVGTKHVALGSDYDGAIRAPFDVTGIVQITDALLAEGFSEDDIRGIMGGNVLRLLKEALPEG